MKNLFLFILLFPLLAFSQFNPIDGNTLLLLQGNTGVTVTATGDSVTIWADQSGNGYDFVQVSPGYPIYDLANDRITFDSTNSQSLNATADEASFDIGASDFTIEIYFVKTQSDEQWLFTKYGAPGEDGYAVGLRGNNRVYTYIRGDGSDVYSTNDGTALSQGILYLVSVVFDRSGNMTRYINGVVDGTEDDISGQSAAIANNKSPAIGIRWNASPDYFDGSIYEIRFSDKARTTAEILDYYNYLINGRLANMVFVDPVSGSDSNSGSSPTTALASFDSINTAGLTLAALDSMAIRTGTTVRGQLTIPRDSVYVTAYDSATGLTGAAALALGDTAVISGADVITGWSKGVEEETFESGSHGAMWDAVEGSVDTYANFSISGDTYGGVYGVQLESQEADSITVTDGTEYWISINHRTGASIASRDYVLSFLNIAGADLVAVHFFHSDSTIRAYDYANTTGYKAGIFTTNTWYEVKARMVLDNALGIIQVWVDGVLIIDQDSIDTDSGNGNIGKISAGNNNSAGQTSYYDNFLYSTTETFRMYKRFITGISTAVNIVYINGTKATIAASSFATDAQDEVFWTTSGSDTLFAFTTDTTLIEAGQRLICIDTNDKSYITISNLHLKYANATWEAALFGYQTGTHLIADYVTVTGSSHAGIWFKTADSSRISNCIVTGTSDWAIQYQDAAEGYSLDIYGNTISASLDGIMVEDINNVNIYNNTISNMDSDGIYWGESNAGRLDTCNIYSNVLSDLGNTTAAGAISTGGGAGDSLFTAIIYDNTISDVDFVVIDGYGIDLDVGSMNCIVRNNNIKDCDGAAIAQIGDGTVTKNNQIYYNLIDSSEAGLLCGSGTDSSEWYNNTINECVYGIRYVNADTGHVFKNNIISNSTGYHFYGDADSRFTSDYNLFYPDGASKFRYNDVDSDDFADWQNDSSGDANSPTPTDPLFTDAANANFTLTARSPAIDAGVNVGLVLDYDGNTVPAQVNRRLVDIGAYEFLINLGYQKRYKRFSDYWRYRRY